MAERTFSPGRLESISDGVIAVIITIMVLSLTPPRSADPAALAALWPSFVAYFVSFVFVAIYWVNHRYLFRFLRAVDDRILWSNMLLLFVLSMVPFGAAYMGQTGLARFPVAADAALMLVCGAAYLNLRVAIGRHVRSPEEAAVFNEGRARWVNLAALAVYVLAIPAALINPLLSLALNLTVSVVYFTPYPRPDLNGQSEASG
jgi:uncharacterized membrane protein